MRPAGIGFNLRALDRGVNDGTALGRGLSRARIPRRCWAMRVRRCGGCRRRHHHANPGSEAMARKFGMTHFLNPKDHANIVDAIGAS
jgi:hypothetical protein